MKSGSVAIIGRPNSGKSTLLNSLVGRKISIVSDKPQTTRHRILAVHADARGQVAFVDTPGIHKPLYRMNTRMQQAVREALEGVDLVLLVVDGAASFGAGEEFVLQGVKELGSPVLLLINKIDKVAKPRLLPIMDHYAREHGFREIIPISALTGDNLIFSSTRSWKIFPIIRPSSTRIFSPIAAKDSSRRNSSARKYWSARGTKSPTQRRCC